MQVGGGHTPALNLMSERDEHFHVPLANSQVQRSPTMGINLLPKGPFANELPTQNPKPYDPIRARREPTSGTHLELGSDESLAHPKHLGRVHSTLTQELPLQVKGLHSIAAHKAHLQLL